jgi:hypothetical protein
MYSHLICAHVKLRESETVGFLMMIFSQPSQSSLAQHEMGLVAAQLTL